MPRRRVLFRDRRDAGRRLAERLDHLKAEQPVVLGLPRGGVPVAYEVAAALGAPLDVVLVRKLGAPLQPEYGIGAVGEEGILLVNRSAVRALGVEEVQLAAIVERERAELERRRYSYRCDREPVSVAGRTVVLVDDGIATGSTAVAAARVLRRRGAAKVVLAVPVGPPGAAERLAGDELVCLESPPGFFSVGVNYASFEQTSDAEVQHLLARAAGAEPADPPPAPRGNGGTDWNQVRRRSVEIPAGPVRLPGELRIPPDPRGLVIFAHGSGSSRLSPRNVQVASALNGARLATLLFDLLTEDEALERHNVFDIGLLGDRLVAATRWARDDAELAALPIGYFGASTGAAAALCAAGALGGEIRAVVSRGGRPDLAGHRLAEVTAPTLLIVGGDDWNVLELNDEAATVLRCPHRLDVVPHATHLFEEPGALERVAQLATDWFVKRLAIEGGQDEATVT